MFTPAGSSIFLGVWELWVTWTTLSQQRYKQMFSCWHYCCLTRLSKNKNNRYAPRCQGDLRIQLWPLVNHLDNRFTTYFMNVVDTERCHAFSLGFRVMLEVWAPWLLEVIFKPRCCGLLGSLWVVSISLVVSPPWKPKNRVMAHYMMESRTRMWPRPYYN